MDHYTYRPFRKRDLPALIKLCETAWDYRDYTSDEKTRMSLVKLDAVASLAGADYIRVASRGNRLVGVLIGSSRSPVSGFRNVTYLIRTWLLVLKLLLFGDDASNALQNFKNMEKVYKDLLGNRKKAFDSEVVLFIVDPKTQGGGVGKRLMNDYLKHCKKHDMKKIFLYTDTSCNYGFYDYNGFKQEASEDMSLTLNEGEQSMRVFLYSKTNQPVQEKGA